MSLPPGERPNIISPFLRLFSVYNRCWFEIQRALKWSRPHYRETVAGVLQDLTSTQFRRIRQLKMDHPVVFENRMRQLLALANYLYLDLLDRARQVFQWGATLVDVGSQNFYYAPALHGIFQPQKLTGVEVEGYRVCQGGFSRFDYATAYIRGLPNT